MCGRFTLGATVATLATQFDLANVPTWTPHYNIAPTQEVLVVRQPSPQANREARLRRWGLVPSWAKDPAIGHRLINAHAETVASKPAFRRAFRDRRCLVLADGFYECTGKGRASSRITFVYAMVAPSPSRGCGNIGRVRKPRLTPVRSSPPRPTR